MNWKERCKTFLNSIKQDRSALSVMRDDLNDNIKECTKLLYRLEEAERKINDNTARLAHKEGKTSGSIHNTF